MLGTPFYMSPEQAQALPDVDGRTDLWSVGAILFECLTGRPPHTGDTYEQVIVSICMHDAPDVRPTTPACPRPSRPSSPRRSRAIATSASPRRARCSRPSRQRRARRSPTRSSPGLGASSTGVSSSPDFKLTPRGPSLSGDRARAIAPEPRAAAAPIEVHVASGTKVGWSTSGRATNRREARWLLLVAASALLAGSVGAFAFVRARAPARPPPSQQHDEIRVKLQANVAGARFSVDGAPLPSGVLEGQRGEVKKVRVEAEGYAPSEIAVTLTADAEPVRVVLVAALAPIAPLAVVSPDAAIASAKSADLTKKPRDTTKIGASAPPHPTAPPPAAPGVGGGQLKLKTD